MRCHPMLASRACLISGTKTAWANTIGNVGTLKAGMTFMVQVDYDNHVSDTFPVMIDTVISTPPGIKSILDSDGKTLTLSGSGTQGNPFQLLSRSFKLEVNRPTGSGLAEIPGLVYADEVFLNGTVPTIGTKVSDTSPSSPIKLSITIPSSKSGQTIAIGLRAATSTGSTVLHSDNVYFKIP